MLQISYILLNKRDSHTAEEYVDHVKLYYIPIGRLIRLLDCIKTFYSEGQTIRNSYT